MLFSEIISIAIGRNNKDYDKNSELLGQKLSLSKCDLSICYWETVEVIAEVKMGENREREG